MMVRLKQRQSPHLASRKTILDVKASPFTQPAIPDCVQEHGDRQIYHSLYIAETGAYKSLCP